MREIPLSGKAAEGLVCLVDDEDYEKISKFRWHLDRYGYAYRNYQYPDGRRSTVRMHQQIKPCKMLDHVDGNKLNNQKENLRPCDKSTNAMNSKKKSSYAGKKPTSEYRGVYYQEFKKDRKGIMRELNKKWRMNIKIPGKVVCLCFYTELEAALAYDELARIHHGEFARLNFPEGYSPELPSDTQSLEQSISI
jgi:hypothetical protein